MTPAFGLKHWWRAERREGESLKAFARRYAGWKLDGSPSTTSARWLAAKRRRRR